MKVIEKLFSSEQGSSIHAVLEQSEREAIIDLMVLAVYVDNHLSLSESAFFDDARYSLGWESSNSLDFYISSAVSRARGASGIAAQVLAFLNFIAERLHSTAARERALELLDKLFISDGKTEAEEIFLTQTMQTDFSNPLLRVVSDFISATLLLHSRSNVFT